MNELIANFNLIVVPLSLALTLLASFFTFQSYKKFTQGQVKNLTKWLLMANIYISCFLLTMLVALIVSNFSPNATLEFFLNFLSLAFLIIASTCIIKTVLVVKELAQEFGFNK
ncbi:MAG: hypothetical protein AB1467_05300 [Candidatus Diapherotrites archaeon]